MLNVLQPCTFYRIPFSPCNQTSTLFKWGWVPSVNYSITKMAGTVSSDWEIPRTNPSTEDGRRWPYTCFMPSETYSPHLSINLNKHHMVKTCCDMLAYFLVKLLKIPVIIFFGKGFRPMVLETLAAVPGIVGGAILHLKSVRKFQKSGGWIKALHEEAENKRMHIMILAEIKKPTCFQRFRLFIGQYLFFCFFFLQYWLFPKMAHRVAGYLNEEAIKSYTQFDKEIEKGKIVNAQAPKIALDYWRLSNATLKDIVKVIQADQAHHRDANHFAADILDQGKQLREVPAPIGYH